MPSSAPRVARTAGALVLAGLLALGLSACGNSATPVKDYPGEPRGVPAPPSSAGGAAFSVWLEGGNQFTVTLYGSSGCPPVGTGYTLKAKNWVVVQVKDYGNRACTADYVPHTTVFSTPNTIDRNRDVTITAKGQTFVLAGLPQKK